MKVRAAQGFLGVYFMILCVAVSMYMILFADSKLFPMDKPMAKLATQLVLPVFMGQLTAVFTWFVSNLRTPSSEQEADVPTWLIVAPPAIVTLMMLVAFVSLVLSNREEAVFDFDPESFVELLMVAMSILNVSTVVVVGSLFRAN